MENSNIVYSAKTSAQISYKLEKIRDGNVLQETDFVSNMITDDGIDRLMNGQSSWVEETLKPMVGNDPLPDPVRRDSGLITFTQSGNTLTASAPFFRATDTGTVFKWGTGSSGKEMYLTYVSDTVCTTNVSDTVTTPDIGTIWYVNISSLKSPLNYINNYIDWTSQNSAIQNYSQINSASGDSITQTLQYVKTSRTFTSSANITEIGFAHYSVNSPMIDRDVISPPMSFSTGDQIRVTLRMSVTYTGINPKSLSNTGTGFDNSGTASLESIGVLNGGIDAINSSAGISTSQSGLTAKNLSNGRFRVYHSPITLTSFNSNSGPYRSSFTNPSSTIGTLTYIPGSRYLDRVFNFDYSMANNLIYGWGTVDGSGNSMHTHKLNTPFTKTDTQTLKITLRTSIDRILTN